jgi:hypothetical protein
MRRTSLSVCVLLSLAGARPNSSSFSGPEVVDAPLGAKEEIQMIAWILTGLIAGWLAGKVMKGGGYGIIMDSDYCGLHWSGHPGLDYPPAQEDLKASVRSGLDFPYLFRFGNAPLPVFTGSRFGCAWGRLAYLSPVRKVRFFSQGQYRNFGENWSIVIRRRKLCIIIKLQADFWGFSRY